ncbi:MAG: MBL fold metallo-hydrolase [Candidatus Hydrothermarchaeota archaeon]
MAEIEWLGHACFKITDREGICIVTDPFSQKDVGYRTPEVEADIALVSHDHFDHNKVKVLKGKPSVIKGEGKKKAKNIEFKGIETFHDDSKGRMRGKNTVFVFEVDGVRFCHLGDLGHILDENQIRDIGEVDVLFIPVGGTFTINAREADKVIEQLTPKIIVPMHYKTEVVTLPIEPLNKFLENKTEVERTKKLIVERETLPEVPKIVVLEYE